MLSNSNPVPKLYLSIIEDVIESMRELFLDEGVEERVLEDLRQLWESKVMQSKAVEGFMKDALNPSNFVLQLPASYAQSLHKPTGNLFVALLAKASVVIPAGQNVQNFTTKAKNTGSIATFSLPPGMSYPVQIPAGVTLQTSSGHLYKVNVPVMVTQAPGANRILSQTVQRIVEAREPAAAQRAMPPSVLHTMAPQVTELYPPPAPTRPRLDPPKVQQVQQVQQVQHVQQVQQVQQQQVFLNRCAPSCPPAPPPPVIPQALLPPPVSPGDDQFTLEGIEFSPRLLDMGLPSHFPAQLSDLQAKTGQAPASGSVVGVRGEIKGDAGAVAERPENARPEDPAKLDYNHNVLEDIVQLDGACGGSSSEGEGGEEEEADGVTENEFLGMINAEALRALQEGEGSTAGGSSDSCSDGADEFAEEEEEDPLNSGDDVSEQDIPDLFDTDNVVVCQYDKIHRSKNRWKFYLKDGVMCFGGKDYVFSKAVGEAEW